MSRSKFRGEAADLYLDALARRWGLRAAVLADPAGLAVAATGPRFARDPLSAYGAHATASGAARDSATDGPRSLPLRIGSWQLSLTVLGGGELPQAAIERDLERILALD